jgi:hypothetical protein
VIAPATRKNVCHPAPVGAQLPQVSRFLGREAFVVASLPGWPVRYTAT